MTDTPMTPPEEDDALAAEYVLGVLDLPERLALEARIKSDAIFAARVTAWETRLAGLNDAFDEAPAPDLMPQIEARLFPVAARPQRAWFGWLAGALAAVAIAGAAYVVLQPAQAPGIMLAELGSVDGGLAYEARHTGTQLQVRRVAGTAPGGAQDHELWIIAPGAAPVSLGLLRGDTLSVDYPQPPAGWILAVSVEPAGGSPTGAPTGPVILTAEISA